MIAATPVSADIQDAYGKVIRNLAAGMAGWLGGPAILMLSPSAQRAMVEIETAVEPTLAENGELAALADWGAKYVGAIARIAGIIHLAEHGSDAGPKTPVTAVTILAASRMGAYFKASAINVFIEMGTDSGTSDAVHLLDRVHRLGVDEVSEREMHAAARSRFRKKVDLIPAIARLVDHGYLTPLDAPEPSTPGALLRRATGSTPVHRIHTIQTIQAFSNSVDSVYSSAPPERKTR